MWSRDLSLLQPISMLRWEWRSALESHSASLWPRSRQRWPAQSSSCDSSTRTSTSTTSRIPSRNSLTPVSTGSMMLVRGTEQTSKSVRAVHWPETICFCSSEYQRRSSLSSLTPETLRLQTQLSSYLSSSELITTTQGTLDKLWPSLMFFPRLEVSMDWWLQWDLSLLASLLIGFLMERSWKRYTKLTRTEMKPSSLMIHKKARRSEYTARREGKSIEIH